MGASEGGDKEVEEFSTSLLSLLEIVSTQMARISTDIPGQEQLSMRTIAQAEDNHITVTNVNYLAFQSGSNSCDCDFWEHTGYQGSFRNR